MDEAKKPTDQQGTLADGQVPGGQTEPTQKKEDGPADAGTPSPDFDARLKEMESALGKYKQELGEEREKVKAYEQWAYQMRQQQGQPPVPPQKPNYDEQFFDKPTETVEHLVNAKLGQFYAATSQQQAPIAKAMARLQNPGAFEGLSDAELDQAMYGGVQSGATNPALLNDPNGWIGAAWILQGKKHNYAIPSQAPGPMNPTQGETPGMPKKPSAEDDTPVLEQPDDLTEMLIQRRPEGTTREEFLKKVQTRREIEGSE